MSTQDDFVTHEAATEKKREYDAHIDDIARVFWNDEAKDEDKDDSEEYTAQCHCGSIRDIIDLPLEDIPYKGYICCCTVCRLTSGGFGGFFVTFRKAKPLWRQGKPPRRFNVPYAKPDDDDRPFCGTCGACNNNDNKCLIDIYTIDTSLFIDQFWQFAGIRHSGTTGDGGLLPWLPTLARKEPVTYNNVGEVAPTYELEVGSDGGPRLRAKCCCGGVSFTIPRPSAAVREDTYLRKYISPIDPQKWKAFLDVSNETRRTSGIAFMPWMLVPRVALEPEVPSDLLLGTMKTYKSSEKVTRGFCGTCGAKVFLKTTDRSPSEDSEVLGIAMGILRAPEGMRADNWVTWRAGRLEGVPDKGPIHDNIFVGDLRKGHKAWALEKYGEAPEFDIM
ncbi:hypothetical protein GGR53DRAFT_481912 [Hypoxylon sp. FL1150]|nr:hypothetical protein GGR53DRAFT_481912 [Hypoxylon sp. FL1150]